MEQCQDSVMALLLASFVVVIILCLKVYRGQEREKGKHLWAYFCTILSIVVLSGSVGTMIEVYLGESSCNGVFTYLGVFVAALSSLTSFFSAKKLLQLIELD